MNPELVDEAILIGSGPSAGKFPRQSFKNNLHIACVNDSWKLAPRVPDFYLVAEIPAATVYQGIAATVLGNGGKVFMRPAALQQLTINHCGAIQTIDKHFGPPELHELHKARPLPRASTGPRPNAPWISSGVLMLWVLAELYAPRRIFVAGLDGYPAAQEVPQEPVKVQGDTKIEGEYAKGVRALESRPFRTPVWTEAMNKLMAAGIKAITNHYTQTEFVWLSRPNHYRESWRVSIKGD